MDPTLNMFLTLAPGVVRTPETDKVICNLDARFAMKGIRGTVTSIKRTAEKQLEIIKDLCDDHKVRIDADCKVKDQVMFGSRLVYAWQVAWSRLLNKGVIVNPPLAAEVLFDYFVGGENRIGKIIQPSPHFKGKSFDIGARDNFDEKLDVVKEASKDRSCGIRAVTVERKNNCIHVDCF